MNRTKNSLLCGLIFITSSIFGMQANAAPFSTTFDASAEGWFLTNQNTGTPIVDPMSYSGDGTTASLGCAITTTGLSNISIAGASPTGTNYAADVDSTGGITWFRSPDLGGLDMASTLGGTVSFSSYTYQLVPTPGGPPPGGWTETAAPNNTDGHMKVELEGTNGTVVQLITASSFDKTPWQAGNWIDFSFPIDDASWTGTLADLNGVLASVRNIRIRAEFIFGGNSNVCSTTEYFALDEFRMNDPAAPSLIVDKPAPTNADEDGSGTVTVGDTLTYTITATNNGNVDLNNVIVSDPLITPTAGTTPCATVAPAGICTLIGTYQVLPADLTIGQIFNTATADSDETGAVTETETTIVVASPIGPAPAMIPVLNKWALLLLTLLLALSVRRYQFR